MGGHFGPENAQGAKAVIDKFRGSSGLLLWLLLLIGLAGIVIGHYLP
jgi:hypothetical protein